jgi:glycosyltransferase involved in cell wall biosynthesis
MPIKVLHVTFDMTIGGTQQVIRQLVENMDQAEIHSEIVCIDGKLGELGEILQEQGIPFHILKRQLGFDTSLVRKLFDLIKTNHYDVVHCHQYTPYIYGLLTSLFTGAKVIFTEHGRFYPDYGTWKRKLINPVFSLFTSKLTAISEATKDALVQYESFERSKIEVIYNGIADMSQIEVDESELKNEFGIPEAIFLFGTVSRLQPIKNQQMMINAFKQVHDQEKNTHLLIVGDGEVRGQLEKLVIDLSLSDCVTFTGFQNDPYRFHKIIDVFLLPSFSEGASMTLLEAMSFSKPCIVTNVGGSPELIVNTLNGIVIPSDDTEALVSACNKLYEDSELKNDMGMKGRKRFDDSFNVTLMVQRYMALYQKMIIIN